MFLRPKVIYFIHLKKKEEMLGSKKFSSVSKIFQAKYRIVFRAISKPAIV